MPSGKMKCEYCGADLFLAPDGRSYRFRSEVMCPKCGALTEASAWFCPKCETVLTKDIGRVKEHQNRIKVDQENARKALPSWIREKLENDEYVYSVFTFKNMGDFYAATNKRVIKSLDKKYYQATYGEITLIGRVEQRLRGGLGQYEHAFDVDTINGGKIVFDGFPNSALNDCYKLNQDMNTAMHYHINHLKNPITQLWKLKLPEPFTDRETAAGANAQVQEKIHIDKSEPKENGDVFEKIRKLAELRDSGILTEEEFQQKKKEWLESI